MDDMSLFSQILELFGSLFGSSKPENQLKQEIKKIETALKQYTPAMYKNQMLLPNMGEAFRQLHSHLIPLEKLFSATIASGDATLKAHYTDVLLETGFSDKGQQLIEQLEYANRKEDLMISANPARSLEAQKRNLQALVQELSSTTFIQIEKTLRGLDSLVDLCRFSFTPVIRLFCPDYSSSNPDGDYQFEATSLDQLENYLEDFYFITAGISITASTGRALNAIAVYHSRNTISEAELEKLSMHLRKTSVILNRILTPTLLLNLLCLAKNNPNYQGKINQTYVNYLQEYTGKLRTSFENNTKLITSELQDEHIQQEIAELFEDKELAALSGYTAENSVRYTTTGAGSFLWITPLQIIKSFCRDFMNESVTSLLNDIVVEGFFNNDQYKSDFSAIVYEAAEVAGHIAEFEKTFEKEGKNDVSLMDGYIKDSHRDPSFMQSLAKMIENINKEAKALIQSEVTVIGKLSKRLEELIPDARKTKPEIVANLKVLFASSRNHEGSDYLEMTFPKWSLFLEIMRNYAIIGEVREVSS